MFDWLMAQGAVIRNTGNKDRRTISATTVQRQLPIIILLTIITSLKSSMGPDETKTGTFCHKTLKKQFAFFIRP